MALKVSLSLMSAKPSTRLSSEHGRAWELGLLKLSSGSSHAAARRTPVPMARLVLAAMSLTLLWLLPATRGAGDEQSTAVNVRCHGTSTIDMTVENQVMQFDCGPLLSRIELKGVMDPVRHCNVMPFYEFAIEEVRGEKIEIKGGHGDLRQHLTVDHDYCRTGGRLSRTIYYRASRHPALHGTIEYWVTMFEGLPYVFLRLRLTAHDHIKLSWKDIWTFGSPGVNALMYPSTEGVSMAASDPAIGSRRQPCRPTLTGNWIRLFHDRGQGLDIVFSESAGRDIWGYFEPSHTIVFRYRKAALKAGDAYEYGLVLRPTQYETNAERIREFARLYTPQGRFRPIALTAETPDDCEYTITTDSRGLFPVRQRVGLPSVSAVRDAATGEAIRHHFDPREKTLTMLLELSGRPLRIRCHR